MERTWIAAAAAAFALIAPSPGGQALVLPASMPEVGVRCEYEGVFPGAGAIGRWTYEVGENGAYRIELSDPAQLRGILAHRLGEVPQLALVDWSVSGLERRAGTAINTFERLSVRAQVQGSGALAVETTVRGETICPGSPRAVKPGDVWGCSEAVVDSWTVTGSPTAAPSGTEISNAEVRYEYLRDEDVDAPGGETIRAALIESKSDDGGVERRWLDLDEPWCPARVERLRIGHVVGTDRRLSLVLPTPTLAVAPEPAPPQPGSPIWPWAAGALLLAAVFAHVIRRRRRG